MWFIGNYYRTNFILLQIAIYFENIEKYQFEKHRDFG